MIQIIILFRWNDEEEETEASEPPQPLGWDAVRDAYLALHEELATAPRVLATSYKESKSAWWSRRALELTSIEYSSTIFDRICMFLLALKSLISVYE